MILISIHINEEWRDIIDGLVKEKLVPSRAEYIRTAVLAEFRRTKVMFPVKGNTAPLLERLKETLGESKQ